MAKKVKYLLTVNGTKRAIRLDPDIYDSVNEVLGLTKAADGDKSESTSSSELLKNGQAIAISASFKKANGSYGKVKLICDLDNAVSAIATLPDKKVKTFEIINAGFSRNRRLG